MLQFDCIQEHQWWFFWKKTAFRCKTKSMLESPEFRAVLQMLCRLWGPVFQNNIGGAMMIFFEKPVYMYNIFWPSICWNSKSECAVYFCFYFHIFIINSEALVFYFCLEDLMKLDCCMVHWCFVFQHLSGGAISLCCLFDLMSINYFFSGY